MNAYFNKTRRKIQSLGEDVEVGDDCFFSAVRETLGLKTNKFAKKLRISRQQLHRILKGTSHPSTKTLVELLSVIIKEFQKAARMSKIEPTEEFCTHEACEEWRRMTEKMFELRQKQTNGTYGCEDLHEEIQNSYKMLLFVRELNKLSEAI